MFNGAKQESFKYMIVAENNTLSDFCGNGFSMTHTFILQFLIKGLILKFLTAISRFINVILQEMRSSG